MSLPEQTRGAVNGHCACLRSKYDEFRVTGDTVELSNQRFETAREGYVGGASAFVHDDDRLLLIQTRDTGDPGIHSVFWGPDPNRGLVEDFVAAVREDRSPAKTGAHAVHDIEVIQAAYAAAKGGEPVVISEVA